jgi:signal transduction histidine kinase
MIDLRSPISSDSFDLAYVVTRPYFQVILTVIALIIIIIVGAFPYLYQPYSGMEIYWDEDFGRVSAVYPDGPADQAGIMVDDQLLSIDGSPLVQWNNAPAYRSGIRSGDIVVFELRRGQETLHIPVTIGNYLEKIAWFWPNFLIHFLAISFWVMGAAICLFSPANDVRARLLGLGFLLAGMTATVGFAGGWNSFWGANVLGIILRVWLGPVYVAAHLLFPVNSFPKYRKIINNGFGLIASGLTILILVSAWMLSPGMLTVSDSIVVDLRRVAQIFFIISLFVGIALLVYNRVYSKDAEVRRQTSVVLWGNVLGFSPYLIFVVMPYTFFGVQFTSGLTSLVFLVLVPLSYIYVIYQRKLLRVDFVINRFVVLFVFSLLVLIVSILILGVLSLVFTLSPGVLFLGVVVAVLIALPSAALQRNVQVRVNRVLYGRHYDFSTVTAEFSSRLAVTLDRNALFELLTRDLSTQMGIQQAALFLADGDSLAQQPAQDETVLIPVEDIVSQFLLDARTPMRSQYLWRAVLESSQKLWREYDWGELFVPMVFEGQLHGILILGERVSADVYSDMDVRIIATIAYQGALAFENILLVERLRGLTRRLVRVDEDQRKKIARDLHDTVLQDLFFVRQQLSRDQVELAGHLGNIIDQLRRTIKAQRTALLDQGLELALESLVVDMQSLAGDRSQIIWNNAVDRDLMLTDEQATSIFRIVQEAISNALKHAQAKNINVKIELDPSYQLRVLVDDDGIGIFRTVDVRGSQYGMIGMKERALMIGASLDIKSNCGVGTIVTLEMDNTNSVKLN